MSCVLCQNTSSTVTLLDIAQSISEGSGVDQVVSSPGRTRPYPSTEPKGSKQAELLATVSQDQYLYDKKIEKLLADALEEVRSVRGEKAWCVDRADAVGSAHEYSHLPEQGRLEQASTSKPPVILSAFENHFPSITCLEDTVVLNPNDTAVALRMPGRYFQISPRCTFLLATIDQGMHQFCQKDTPGSTLDCADHQLARTFAGEFGLILLDPPWPNRSARRAKVYHSYSERLQEGQHPFHQALRVVDKHLNSSGIAAIWITNKRAIRTLVFESMHSLGLELFQEWIWLKTTIYGEPVTPIDGLWRKPYEILLLFRRTRAASATCSNGSSAPEDETVHHPHITQPRGATQDAGESLQEYPDVQRRVLIAVPDAHSRKPCLKELLKSLLPDNYRALEIFARNLTAGWWSWGDEVLKFNEVLPQTVEVMPE